MYCQIIDRTGWSWEYIDTQMDIPRLFALKQYWAKNPPLREMVQAYLGIKTETRAVTNKPSTACSQNTEADLQGFIELFQAAGGRRG